MNKLKISGIIGRVGLIGAIICGAPLIRRYVAPIALNVGFTIFFTLSLIFGDTVVDPADEDVAFI